MPGLRSVLQRHIENELPADVDRRTWVAGIIGDRPSQYAKSPSLWNAAFGELDLDAIFVSFDAGERDLGGLMDALRERPEVVGGSVTVPHKISILEHLDEIDPMARRIGAVNAYSRSRDGKLTGYNTDASGGLRSLVTALPGQGEPFIETLQDCRVLLLGGGGAARAMAFQLAEAVGAAGRLVVVNRTVARAESLAAAVRDAFPVGECAVEDEIETLVGDADLVVNATTRGQAGRRNVQGGVTLLEGYSALAPANPPVVPSDMPECELMARWFSEGMEDRLRNLRRSQEIAAKTALGVAFMDLVYAPLETPFLAHARLSGHRTLNGKGMNIAQAADAFVERVMGDVLEESGLERHEAYRRVFDTMAANW